MNVDTEVGMEAGRELDALVAEEVMGLDVHAGPWGHAIYSENPVPWRVAMSEMRCLGTKWEIGVAHYSTDISDAWEVVEKTVEVTRRTFKSGYSPNLKGELRWWAMFGDRDATGSADTAPHAIALAALRAVGYEETP